MRTMLGVSLVAVLQAAACGGATASVGDGDDKVDRSDRTDLAPPGGDGTGLTSGGTCAGEDPEAFP